MGPSIKQVTIKEASSGSLFPEEASELQDKYPEEQQKLLQWFVESRVPVSSQGRDLVVLEQVTIRPPYTVDDCLSQNEVILGRVQKLLQTYHAR